MVAGPRLVETHLSWVLLLDDRVLKWKKAVAFDFLDLRDLTARQEICAREVALNRRLAPDVYEGVAELAGPDGSLWEPVVVMRRLPDDRRLATLVGAGDPSVPAGLDALAAVLARFHTSAERTPEIAAQGRPDRVAARWSSNLRQLREVEPMLAPGARADLAAVEALANSWLAQASGVLDARAEGGSVVDGHGDLQADDVFLLPEGPTVIDCLEFDDDLRAVDIADDVAFLDMDLEHLGHPELGERFVASYGRAAGTPLPRPLVDAWAAYRAVVRAMVTCLRARQADESDQGPMLDDAALLLRIARRRLEAASVTLLLVGGAPGTGKSTVARVLADERGWALLRSDEVRRERQGGRPDRYGADAVHEVYDGLRAEAGAALAGGRSVVLDATWSSAAERAAATDLARTSGARVLAIRCDLDPALAAERVARRAAEGTDASEATPSVARMLAASFDPWPEAEVLDTSEAPEPVADRARALLARLTSPPPPPSTAP